MAKGVHICHVSESKRTLAAFRHKSINLDSNTEQHTWKDLAWLHWELPTDSGEAAGMAQHCPLLLGAAADDSPMDMGRCRAHLVAGARGMAPVGRWFPAGHPAGKLWVKIPLQRQVWLCEGKTACPGGNAAETNKHFLQLQPQTPI